MSEVLILKNIFLGYAAFSKTRCTAPQSLRRAAFEFTDERAYLFEKPCEARRRAAEKIFSRKFSCFSNKYVSESYPHICEKNIAVMKKIYDNSYVRGQLIL